MLNGQNTFGGGRGGDGGGQGFPGSMNQSGTGGGQYGVGPPLRGAGGAGGFSNQMGAGAGAATQSPFSGGVHTMNGPARHGLEGQRLSLDGRNGRATGGGAPPGLTRQASGGVQMAGATRALAQNAGSMGSPGSAPPPGQAFPRPEQRVSVDGMQASAGAGNDGLFAMINKQTHGGTPGHAGANLASFGGGGGGFPAGMSGANVLGDGAAGGMNAAGAPPGFDLNDFPSLGGQGMQGRGGMGGGGFAGGGMAGVGAISHGGFGMGGMGMAQSGAQIAGGGLFGGMDGMGSADGYGVLGGVLQKPHPEFTMQNEDFPALGGGGPGGGGGATGGQGNAPGKNLASSLQSANFPPMGSGGGGRGTLGGGHGGFPSLGSANGGSLAQKGGPSSFGSAYQGSQTGGAGYGGGGYDSVGVGAGAAVSGQTGGTATTPGPDVDRFGLLGLLSVIRMSDPDLTTLALGTDLTTLGLNLNSPDPLYKTFGSPWSDAPPRHELELALPACYAVHTKRASPGAFAKFTPETLFYVFYSSPGDETRLFAADELTKRGWGFHKELKAWLTRVAGSDPVTKTSVGERGSFWIFDVQTWERVRKDNFNLQYDALELAPGGEMSGSVGGAE